VSGSGSAGADLRGAPELGCSKHSIGAEIGHYESEHEPGAANGRQQRPSLSGVRERNRPSHINNCGNFSQKVALQPG
jgi:hypothetical protein